MSDLRIRAAERSGDLVRWLAECRRAGIVTENDCRLHPRESRSHQLTRRMIEEWLQRITEETKEYLLNNPGSA